MIGLPLLTGAGGFRPTVAMFVVSWLFALAMGLLLLEVNLWFTEEVSILSMADRTLGKIGKYFGGAMFISLFYSLMTSYVGGCGQLFSDFAQETLGIMLPEWVGGFIVSAVFGFFLYLGTHTADRLNRVLMGGLILSYLVLLVVGLPHVDRELLTYENWGATIYALPIMIAAFGYHNMIPTLTTYLKHNANVLRLTILIGSTIPLLIYLSWEWVILGMIPAEGPGGFSDALNQGDMVTRTLRHAVGSSWIVDVAEYFAFFAIITSFLAVALSFVDFLADGLRIKRDAKGKVLLCTLSLGPPFVCAVMYPKIFLAALSYAGGFGVPLLFGVLTGAMVWSGRYVKKFGGQHLLPGGKFSLLLVIVFSLTLVALGIIL